jgi:hypothetical protein
MCDEIELTITTIRPDGACLCRSTTEEIEAWIRQLPCAKGERWEIKRTAWGFTAETVRMEGEKYGA